MDRRFKAKKRNLFSYIASVVLSLFAITLAVLLVWQGSVIIADRAAAVEAPQATQPPVVAVRRIEMQSHYTVERRFTGQIEAPRSASLSFEQGGTLASVLVDDGDQVTEGQILAELDDRSLRADVERLQAARKALRSQLELAAATDKRQTQLRQSGYISAQLADQARIAVDEIRARITETEAAIRIAQIRLEKSKITAPFSGAVNRQLIDAGNTVAGGQTVVSMVESSQPVFRVGVDPQLSESITPGNALQVSISGHTYNATVIAVLPQVDAATRTRVIRATVADAPVLAFGLTGQAVFTQLVSADGAWVPLVALEDGVRGLWTINTLSDDQPPVVQMEAVEVIHADTDRAYVRGTFANKARFVTDGVHRVVAGQTVRVDG
jgi:RND family efflux transporter MFP subunit